MTKNPLPSIATSRSLPVVFITPGAKSTFERPTTASTAASSSPPNSFRSALDTPMRSLL
jgi:hypothetical protein